MVLFFFFKNKTKQRAKKQKLAFFFSPRGNYVYEYIKGKIGHLKSKNGFNVLAEKNKLRSSVRSSKNLQEN